MSLASRPSGVASEITPEDISARLDRLPFLRFHLRIAAILGLGSFFDSFDSLSMGVGLAMIVGTFHMDMRTGATLVSAAFVGQFLGAIAFGYIGERIGRKPAFIIALVIFSTCSLGTALAQSIPQIFWARLVQGVGLGAEVPLAAALFSELVRGNTRGRFVIFFQMLFAAGLVATPIVTLVLYDMSGPEIGWRVLFGIGGFPLILALAAMIAVPESPRWLASKARLAEADAIVTAIEASARRRHVALPPPVPAAPIAIEKTRFQELFQGIYRKRTVVVWTQWFCNYFIGAGYQGWLPLLYMKIGGLPARFAIVLGIAHTAFGLVTAAITASFIDRAGRVPWFAGGFALGSLFAFLGAIATGFFHVSGWLPLMVFGVIMGHSVAVNGPGAYLYTPELYPTRMRAWATSTGSSINRLASSIAPLAVGWLIDENWGISSVFALFGIVAFVGATVMWTMGEETKRRTLESLSP